MDPLLLKYYNRELSHLREMGGEFAAEFPKIAGRLALDRTERRRPEPVGPEPDDERRETRVEGVRYLLHRRR